MSVWAIVICLPSAVWLGGVILWRWRRVRGTAPARLSVTGITVARNEAATIRECLEAMLGQRPALDEVLVYDDSSHDGTREIAEELAASGQTLRVFALPENAAISSPKKRSLADGFGRASGDVIAVTDADCVVPPTWVTMMLAEFDQDTGAVIGASWPIARATISERAYRWERLTANTLMAAACGWGFPASACGHNILYLKTALRDVDAPVQRTIPSGDDDLTVQAIARKGWKVRFCASAESVVRDLGGLRGSRWNQAARHQSVTRYYPRRWRLMFAASIAANVLALIAFVSLPFVEEKISVASALLVKLGCDGLAGIISARKLKLDISGVEIMLASLLLPVWSLWRAVAALFGRNYLWRGRSMSTQSFSVPAPSTHGS